MGKEEFVSVLNLFVQRVGLAEEHRKHLEQDRMLSPERIEGRFASANIDRVQAALQSLMQEGFTEKQLRQAHLVDQKGRPLPYLQTERPLILYTDEAGDGIYLRSHKLGPPGVPVEIYGRDCLTDKCKKVLLVEGEYGAAALQCRHIAALAIPGVSSFSNKNYERLLQLLMARGVQAVTILFDSEDRINERLPSGEANARYKPAARDRWDVELNAVMLSRRLTRDGIGTTVATFPESWRGDDGKVDADGALRAGRTVGELGEVLQQAGTSDAYLEGLPDEARQVIRSKLCEGEVRHDDKGYRIRDGVLALEAVAKPRSSRFSVTLSVNWREVLNDSVDLTCRKSRGAFVKVAAEKVQDSEVQTVEGLLEQLSLAVSARSRRHPPESVPDGQVIHIGSRTALIQPHGLCLLHRNDDGSLRKELVSNFSLRLVQDRRVDDGVEPYHEVVGVVESADMEREVAFPARDLGAAVEFSKTLFDQLGSAVNLYGRRAQSADVVLQVAQEMSQPVTVQIKKVHGWGTGELAETYLTPTGCFDKSGPAQPEGLTVSLEGEQIAGQLGLHWIEDDQLVDLGRHVVEDFVDQHHRSVTLPLLGHTFLAPVLSKLGSIVGMPAMMLRGPSGTRKTTLGKEAQCFFGKFNERVESWRSTPNSLQRTGFFFGDALYLIDDYKEDNVPDVKGARSIIQLYSDRATRGRLHRSATKQGSSYVIQGLLLMTGEDMPGDRASVAARMLVVEVQPFDSLVRGQRCRERCLEYAGVMARYISWLADFGVSWLPVFYNDLVEELGPQLRGVDNQPRIASNLACNALGMFLLLSFLEDHRIIVRSRFNELWKEHLAVLGALGQSTAGLVQEQGGTEMFLATLGDLIATGQCELVSLTGRGSGVQVVGVDQERADPNVFLFFHPAFSAVQEHLLRQRRSLGISERGLRKDLEAKGCFPSASVQVELQNGTRPRVWPIKRELLGLGAKPDRVSGLPFRSRPSQAGPT